MLPSINFSIKNLSFQRLNLSPLKRSSRTLRWTSVTPWSAFMIPLQPSMTSDYHSGATLYDSWRSSNTSEWPSTAPRTLCNSRVIPKDSTLIIRNPRGLLHNSSLCLYNSRISRVIVCNARVIKENSEKCQIFTCLSLKNVYILRTFTHKKFESILYWDHYFLTLRELTVQKNLSYIEVKAKFKKWTSLNNQWLFNKLFM
jgi:hypothetical protein